jgi:hypothetical protein
MRDPIPVITIILKIKTGTSILKRTKLFLAEEMKTDLEIGYKAFLLANSYRAVLAWDLS